MNPAVKNLFARIVDEFTQQIQINATFPDYTNLSALADYRKDFLSRLQRYGVTEKGEDLILHNWVEEFALLVGDLRIHHVLTAGNAQCGKSLINTLLLVDFLVFARLNTIWFYPTKAQVDRKSRE
jgi:hypothetical protein